MCFKNVIAHWSSTTLAARRRGPWALLPHDLCWPPGKCWVLMAKPWISAGFFWQHLSRGWPGGEAGLVSLLRQLWNHRSGSVGTPWCSLGSPLGLCWGWDRSFFLQCLTGVEWLLSKCFLSERGSAASFLALELEEFFYFLSVPVGVSKLLSSPASSVEYMREKEHLRTHHHVIPWVLRSLTFLISLYLLEPCFVCFRYNVPVLSSTCGRKSEQWVYSIFLSKDLPLGLFFHSHQKPFLGLHSLKISVTAVVPRTSNNPVRSLTWNGHHRRVDPASSTGSMAGTVGWGAQSHGSWLDEPGFKSCF